MIWIALAPCFVLHTANAYDLPDGRLALDVTTYDPMFSDGNEGPDTNPHGFERWTIDTAAKDRRTTNGRCLPSGASSDQRASLGKGSADTVAL